VELMGEKLRAYIANLHRPRPKPPGLTRRTSRAASIRLYARPNQLLPPGNWLTWLLLARLRQDQGGRRSGTGVGVRADAIGAQENISETICRHGYTKTVRPPFAVTNRIKIAMLRARGLTEGDKSRFALDHIIGPESVQ
jgi:hypothetical protein